GRRRAARSGRRAVRADARRPRPAVAPVAAVAAARGAGRVRAAGRMIEAPPQAVQLAFAAAFGAVIGSFLNVLIYRLPLGRSVVWPSSACPHCNRELSWYENVPIVSWLALGAKCRTCGAPISARYPFVEALTALMFAAGWWFYGPSVLLASRLVFGCVLVVLFAI